MVYLASCNHDEAGRLGWEGKSKAGDQTGSEVAIVPYTTWNLFLCMLQANLIYLFYKL